MPPPCGCGGALVDEGHPHAEMVEGEDGEPRFVVFGSTFAPSAVGRVADMEFDRCPCASLTAPWIPRIQQMWRVTDGRVEGLAATIGGQPSDAAIHLWDLLGCTMAELNAEIRRRAEARREARRRLGHD